MILRNTEPVTKKDWSEPGPHVGWAMYALGVHRLGEGAGAAQCKGWQYAAPASNSGAVLTRHLMSAAPAEAASNTLSQRAKAAYDKLVALPGAQDADKAYEVRTLCIHALNLRAMWLHAVAGGTDRVIPYSSYTADLQVGKDYPLEEFLKVARREAGKLKPAPAY